ncbi:MAG: hypothetical protein ACE10D_07840 [Planctomycetota bacterium]
MPRTQQDRSKRSLYRRNLLFRLLLHWLWTRPVVFILVLFVPYGQRKTAAFRTEATIAMLGASVERWRQEFGYYPAATRRGLEESLAFGCLPCGPANENIECLVEALDESAYWRADDFESANTDGDRWEFHSLEDGREARELVDGYGTPLVYIPHSLYGRGPFVVVREDGEHIRVCAVRRPGGTFRNPNTYQIISVGKNGKQDLPDSAEWDDVCNFASEH